MFIERNAIADTDPNLRGTFTRRPVIGVILLVSEVEPSVPKLPPEDQIKVSPTPSRIFPELIDEGNDNELPQLQFTIQNFDEIRNILNDGAIPPDFVNGGRNLRFEQIINSLGINQNSRDFLNFFQGDLCQSLMQRNKLLLERVSVHFYCTDYTKKLMFQDFQLFDSYENYIMNYLTKIESESDDVLDMFSHKKNTISFLSI